MNIDMRHSVNLVKVTTETSGEQIFWKLCQEQSGIHVYLIHLLSIVYSQSVTK